MLGYKRDDDGQWIKTGNGVIQPLVGPPAGQYLARRCGRLLINEHRQGCAGRGQPPGWPCSRTCFNWLVAEELLAGSPPSEGVAKPSAETPRERWLNDQELVALWHACASRRTYPVGAVHPPVAADWQRDATKRARPSGDEIIWPKRQWTHTCAKEDEERPAPM